MGAIEATQRLLAYCRKHPVGRRQPLRTAARIFAWQLRSRMSGGPHICRWIENAQLAVERGMSGATGNLYFGLHEFDDMAFLLHFLRPGDLLLDIGANVGTYSVLGAKLCGAEVWAFEPDPTTGRRLLRNIALNALTDMVRVHPFALGATTGEIGFTTGLDAMNHVTDDPGELGQTVAIRRLDDMMEGRSPAMIKIDVEGHEDAAFRGAGNTLADPALLAIEAETVSDMTHAMLVSHGFERTWYDPVARALSPVPIGSANNRLYLRNVDAVRQRVASARRFNIFGWML